MFCQVVTPMGRSGWPSTAAVIRPSATASSGSPKIWEVLQVVPVAVG
jgi:hypothetical protein